jgi:LPXTG-motif cell wall-anchored protein
MQRLNVAKIIGISVFSLSTIVLPLTLPVSAQVTNPQVDRTDVYDDDDNSDWGWLGLIGLAGLAGLAGRKRNTHTTTTYQDSDPVTRSNYRD